MTNIARAIVRPPSATFPSGLTTAGLGAPDLDLARRQHGAYCRALEDAGVELVVLPPDDRYPDSTFVEDTAVVTSRGVVITRPGAPSRAGETATITEAFARLGAPVATIEPPGTVDGGDICQVGDRFLLGRSARTDADGAAQLAGHLAAWGFGSEAVTVPPGSLLHLKSGLSWLGDRRVAVVASISDHPALAGLERIPVPDDEAYAANCIRVNDVVIVPAGFPRTVAALAGAGLRPVTVDVSEFRKMDGGVSCLSLRLPSDLPTVGEGS
jgi:dimethylargininase